MEKVLVTGANGLLGSHVVRELLRKKYAVRALVRESSNLKALDGLHIEIFRGHITEKEDVIRAVAGCSHVIHTAARTTPKPGDIEYFRKPNIQSTAHCIEAALKHPVKRFIYVSTANAFGNGPEENPGNEKKPFMPWLKKSGYAYSKFLAQQMVLDAVRDRSLNAVVVNPTFIIGENDVKPGSGQIFGYILRKKWVFYPPGGKNFVDAGTAARGVVSAIVRGRAGQCYLLAGENLSYKKFFQLAAKTAGQKSIFLPIPSWLLKGLGAWGDFSEKFLKNPVQLTGVNARMLCMDNYYTPEKAMRELHFRMVPAREAVKKAVDWFQKNHYFSL